MKEQQLLRDPNIKPTEEVLAECLKKALSVYSKFISTFENNNIQLNWKYYNDGNAWLAKGLYKWTTTRGTQKEKNTFWLSVWDGYFKITIYIPTKNRAEALNLPVNDETKEMIEKAEQIGKLKFFPIMFELHSDELLNDILTLINFRKSIK